MKWLTEFVLALAGVAAVVALRQATLSTHQPVPPGSSVELTVAAHSRGAERSQGLDELVEAQLATCRLEINSDLIDVGPMPDGEADDRYRAVLDRAWTTPTAASSEAASRTGPSTTCPWMSSASRTPRARRWRVPSY